MIQILANLFGEIESVEFPNLFKKAQGIQYVNI